jgi:acetate---CoA ligase (ADP-forming)
VSRGHTGALAGSGAVYRQAFAQAGVILCEDFDELTQTVELFAAMRPLPKRCNIGMLGTSGGELGRVTDQCVELGVPLPVLDEATLKALQSALYLPADVSPRNPVDVGTGFAFPGSYKDRMGGAIRAVAADPNVDIIAIMQGFRRDNPEIRYSLNREVLSAAAAYATTGGKPIVVMGSQSGYADDEVTAEVRAANLPALEGARPGLLALRHLDRYRRYLDQFEKDPGPGFRPAAITEIAPWNDGSVAQTRLFPWLGSLGLPVPRVAVATSAAEAIAAVARIEGTAVMKIDTPRVVHKSDVGGVALGVIRTTAAATFANLLDCLSPPLGAIPGEAVIVVPHFGNGVEFYVGAKYDPDFGPVVALGLGGRLLELLGRTALLVTPFGKADVLAAIAASGADRLLLGYRGGPIADLDRLADLVMAVGTIALALGDRLEVLDLNPVIVSPEFPQGVVADARLILRKGTR